MINTRRILAVTSLSALIRGCRLLPAGHAVPVGVGGLIRFPERFRSQAVCRPNWCWRCPMM